MAPMIRTLSLLAANCRQWSHTPNDLARRRLIRWPGHRGEHFTRGRFQSIKRLHRCDDGAGSFPDKMFTYEPVFQTSGPVAVRGCPDKKRTADKFCQRFGRNGRYWT